ncbi:MAG: hypothetical protein E2P03_01185 [Acidobacteria bacterium]|nr:MAG: hypothetical protein E2P03_01185 [Acidobacteriota bacterium]
MPVPTVVTNGASSNVATLSVDALNLGNNLNTPSKTGVPCGDCAASDPCLETSSDFVPFFFDDLTAAEGPGAVYGVGLYVYSLPAGAPFRTLLDLEGTASLHTTLINPSSGMACTDNSATGDCPGVAFIPCSSLGGATCLGDLLAPGGGSFDVSSPVVDAALGAPLGENVAVFLTKVHYRGSVAGSQANPGVTAVNASMVSLFSAASTRVSYSALVARVSFTRIDASGNRVVIDFQTVGGSFVEFTIQRADDGVSFVDLGTVAATGETDYSFTDTIRGRRPASATYRIIAEDFNGNLTQIFQSVDLSVKPSRGRSRR